MKGLNAGTTAGRKRRQSHGCVSSRREPNRPESAESTWRVEEDARARQGTKSSPEESAVVFETTRERLDRFFAAVIPQRKHGSVTLKQAETGVVELFAQLWN